MKKAFVYLFLFFFAFLMCPLRLSASGFEKVYLKKVMDSDYKAIIERSNGDMYLIEYGVGVLSLWRYEDKYAYIDSPGLFAGTGSTIVLPDIDQEAHIWNCEEMNGNNASLPTYIEPEEPAVQDSPETSNSNNQNNNSSIILAINGVISNETLYIDNNHLLVPLRLISESLGGKVTWVGNDNLITIYKDSILTMLQIGNNIGVTGSDLTNSQPVTMEVPPQLINGTTYVPLRFVSETLGAVVNWDQNSGIISVNTI